MQPEEVLAEAPHLEPSLQARVQAALERLSAAPRFQLFHDTPTPDAVYSTGDDGAPAFTIVDDPPAERLVHDREHTAE